VHHSGERILRVDQKAGRQAAVFLLSAADGSVSSFAGLWDGWKNPDTSETIMSGTIIATPRRPHVRNHHRRPQGVSRPWKISMPLYRRLEKNAQITEFRCVAFVEELLYGKFRKQAGM
jgi:hypothetical protein